MKLLKEKRGIKANRTWEEESGLITFLSSVNSEVDMFNARFDFGIHNLPGIPQDIDGNTSLPLKAGFILERKNPILPDLTYCLYTLLKGKALYGYIGVYRGGSMKTYKQLKPVKDFKKGKVVLYDWMRQLVRASCDKIMF
jgi:hypothetical protein